jgi:small ligand-binding sensory domain FIST
MSHPSSHSFAAAAHWTGDFEESAVQAWIEKLRASLSAPKVSLGLIFIAPRFFSRAAQILELVRVHARVPLLAGCSSQALVAGGEEIENNPGISLGLYYLPGAELKAFHFTQENVDEANGPGYWHHETSLDNTQVNAWLAFGDPFNLDCDTWLRLWNEAYAPIPVLGGLASGDFSARLTQLYLDGEVYEEGVVAISISGAITLASVISQGCTPIGETWTITKADQNLIIEIANRPAYTVLVETIAKLSPEEQQKSQGNLFIGLVVNEYLEEFKRGDFLIRNFLGADPNSGVLAVGAFPRAGQTMQFQRRDAAAANADMTHLLEQAHHQLSTASVYGGCLCTCNGRGSHLFGYANHDAAAIQHRLGPLGLAGFFCNGEIGPVGEKNFLHGWTAALALFVKKEAK